MDYQVFHVRAASEVGLIPAIILEHIAYWCEKNEANGTNIKDGKAWTYNSVKAWSAMFPFLSPKQVRSALDALVNHGAVEKAALNESRYDRTLWYALTDYGRSLLWPTEEKGFAAGGKDDLPQEANAICPEGRTNTNNNTNNNTQNNTPIVPTSGDAPKKKGELNEEQQERFDRFWAIYPKKQDKQGAIRAWKKLKPSTELTANILAAVVARSKTEDWTKEKGQYVPMPSTYLNRRRWEDVSPLPFGPEPQGSNVSRPDSAAAKAALYANLNAQLERMRREDDEKRGIGG